jgi:hypothetical protein
MTTRAPAIGATPRIWSAFAAVGAGLIHVALVLGAPLPVAVPLAAIGAVEFGWGVLTFARENVPVPRVAIGFAIVPVLGWGFLLAVASVSETPALASALPFVPMSLGCVLGLAVAAILSTSLRRGPSPAKPRGTTRQLAGLGAGVLVICAITALALASTQAGLVESPGVGVHREVPSPTGSPAHESH